MKLASFDHQAFLSEWWQKKPLLIRNPWDEWTDPITPEELAGLACEDAIEARLVVGGIGGPKVEHGPLQPDRFDTLGTKDWTLLVQAVDHHIPEVAALLDPFRFIPNWRIDDVMVSFAADGGGVGAHFDQYDVFLIQGLGQRSWQIGQMCDETSELLPNGDLRLLADFAPTDEWVLEPGDILYVPPGIAHNGAAVSDQCMTYSVGFRAPSRSDLISGWLDDMLSTMSEDDRYGDAGLSAQSSPGEISAEAIGRLHALVSEAVADKGAFARWFGDDNSTRKYPEVDWRPDVPATATQVAQALKSGAVILRNPAFRFAYIEQDGGDILLFVDGKNHECSDAAAKFARAVCAEMQLKPASQMIDSDEVIGLITLLINSGSLAIER